MIRKIAPLILAICLLLPATIAAAWTNPDTTEIKDAKVFRNLLENGDFCVVLHYEISWTASTDRANETSRQLFLIRLMDGNTSLGQVSPYPFHNYGYGESIAGLYWGANESPTWGGNYTLRVEGNPTKWAAPIPLATLGLTGDDYTVESDHDAVIEDMREYIIDIASSIENDWSLVGELYSYVRTGPVLTEDIGEAYFSGAIPGLSGLCPSLFTVQVLQPDIDDKPHPKTFEKELKSQFNNTFIDDGTQALGDLTGVSTEMAGTLATLFGFLVVVIICAFKFQRAVPGFLIASPIALIAAPLGLISLTVLGVVSLLCIIVLMVTYFFEKAGG